MDEEYVGLEQRADGVILARLRGPKEVTTLSSKMLDALEAMVSALEKKATAKAVVFLGTKKTGFMAGADLKELLAAWDEAPDADALKNMAEEAVGRCQRIFDRIAGLPVPTIAAIHGAALGGGYEFALACDARIAADAKGCVIGLPEVLLGLIPAAGGTQRLTRLIGMSNAMELILAGKTMNAKRALRKGLIDRVCPLRALESEAVRYALELVASKKKRVERKPKTGLGMRVMESIGWGRDVIENKSVETVQKKTKGHYPAPVEAAHLIAFAADRNDLSEGLRREREAFGKLASGSVARHLISIFFLKERGDKQSPVSADVPARPVSRVGVVGAGFMGSGVAQLAASKGYRVALKDRDAKSLAKGMKACAGLFDKLAKRGRLGPGGTRLEMAKISPAIDYEDLAPADLVVEAVFEDLDLKTAVLKDVEARVADDCVIATNTSGLPLAKLIPALERPENFVGMHFFSPVHKMPLLEIIKHDKTSDAALQTALKVGQKLGKTCIVVGDGQGFYTTRVLGIYLAEAFRQVLNGASAEAIDKQLESFGWPVGPFKLMDEVGIDIGLHVSEGLHAAFPERCPDPAPIKALLAKGRKGRKSKKGFYTYGGKATEFDQTVYADIPGRRAGQVDTKIAVDEIMAVLVNECVMCLEEGVLATPEDGDTGIIFGLGFPPFLGGLFRWVDEQGAEVFVETLKTLDDNGVGNGPCELLVQRAKDGSKFYGEA